MKKTTGSISVSLDLPEFYIGNVTLPCPDLLELRGIALGPKHGHPHGGVTLSHREQLMGHVFM